MAAVSPAGATVSMEATVSSDSATTTPIPSSTASPAPTGNKPPALPTVTLQRSEPPKNLRGLNKPKCIKCGNVARSRCPYQSCKSCCSKAQNPCHIHVLKPNATLADRSPSSNSTQSEQQPIEPSSSGPASRTSSVRQLSSPFAQFNNVHLSLRSRKPLTRKDAITINEWRFSKLKEFRDRNIEVENEAFDQYMQNISLLEEVFDIEDTRPMDNSNTAHVPIDKARLLCGMKVIMRSDPTRSKELRKRVRNVVEQGLVKLKKRSEKDSLDNGTEHDETPKKAKVWEDEKASVLNQLNDKINKARNDDDLNQCLQIWSQFTTHVQRTSEAETSITENSEVQINECSLPAGQAPENSLQKLVKTNVISQEALNKIDLHFSSLEEIEDL